jgi:hypothetical protein
MFNINKMCEVIDVPNEIIKNIFDYITTTDLICDGYAKYLDGVIPHVEPWLTNSLRKLHPHALVTGAIIYLGGGPADLHWHIDLDTRYWGPSYTNCTIPLYIDNVAGIKTIESVSDDIIDIIDEETVDEGEADEVSLTLVNRDSTFFKKKYKVYKHMFEEHKAYVFSAGKPHRTLPGGMRISLMFNFVTNPIIYNPKIYYGGSRSFRNYLNLIFNNGQLEEKAETVLQRIKDSKMDKNKVYYTEVNNAWRVCWLNTITLFKKYLKNKN